MKSAGRREALEGLASGLYVQGLLLVSGILAARLLGPDDRGQLALIWVVVLTLVQVGMLGMPLAVTYEIANGRSARNVLAAVSKVAALQLVAIVALYLAAASVILDGTVPLGPIAVAVALLPSWVIQGYVLAALQGVKSFRALHVLRVLAATLYTVFLVGGVVAGESSLLFVTVAWVAAYVVSGAGSWFALRHLLRAQSSHGTSEDPPNRRAMFRFGLAGFLGSVSPTETFRVDQLVVGLVLSTTDLGLYVAALAFCGLPRFLAQGLGLVAYPRIASESEPAMQRRLLWRFSAMGSGAALVVAAPLALLAGPLMTLAFGDEFAGAATTMQILILGTVLLCARRMLSDCLRGVGAPGSGSWAEGISLIALVPAMLLFVPPLGLEGVGIAIGAAYAVSLGALLIDVQRRGLGLRRG